MPPIVARLRKIGDSESVAVLDIIVRDEVGHSALADRWFKRLCVERGLEPEQTIPEEPACLRELARP